MTSSSVSVAPGAGDDARQRPLAPIGCGTPIDGRLRDLGCAMSSFSSSTDEIHSPPDLIRSLVRSTSRMRPRASTVATSPVRSQPSVGEALAGALVVVVGARRSSCRGTAARRCSRRPTAPARRYPGRRPGISTPKRCARPSCAGRPARSIGRSASSTSMMATAAIGLVSVMPHACRIGRPSCSRYASTAPWAPRTRRTGSTAGSTCRDPSSSGSTCIQIVGTPAATVTRSSTIRSATRRARQIGAGHDEGGAGATPA